MPAGRERPRSAARDDGRGPHGDWLVKYEDASGEQRQLYNVKRETVSELLLKLAAEKATSIEVYRPVEFKLVTTCEVVDG